MLCQHSIELNVFLVESFTNNNNRQPWLCLWCNSQPRLYQSDLWPWCRHGYIWPLTLMPLWLYLTFDLDATIDMWMWWWFINCYTTYFELLMVIWYASRSGLIDWSFEGLIYQQKGNPSINQYRMNASGRVWELLREARGKAIMCTVHKNIVAVVN